MITSASIAPPVLQNQVFRKQTNQNSREIKGYEQSYLGSRFATPECTLTAPHDKVEKFKFG